MSFRKVTIPQPSKTSQRSYRRVRSDLPAVFQGDRPIEYLYIDEETGLVTADVGAFEQWMHPTPEYTSCYLSGCERGCVGHER